MNYLYKNRDNSRKLPFDVMNIIYEYADPMIQIRKQIVNKEYNLDIIMFERMVKYIKNEFSGGLTFYLNYYEEINENNIYIHKQSILNYYKRYILYNALLRTRICGLDRRYNFFSQNYLSQRTKIIMDLELNNIKVNNKYSTKQLYKKWLKL